MDFIYICRRKNRLYETNDRERDSQIHSLTKIYFGADSLYSFVLSTLYDYLPTLLNGGMVWYFADTKFQFHHPLLSKLHRGAYPKSYTYVHRAQQTRCHGDDIHMVDYGREPGYIADIHSYHD